MTLIFNGRRFLVYGIRGRNGGKGEMIISGRSPEAVDFRAATKQVHRLVFDSGDLSGTVQAATLSVMQPDGARNGYVNVEEVEIY